MASDADQSLNETVPTQIAWHYKKYAACRRYLKKQGFFNGITLILNEFWEV